MKEKLIGMFKGEKFKEFSRKVFGNKKAVVSIVIVGLLVAFGIGHSISFGAHRGQGGQMGRGGNFAQVQMQNGQGQLQYKQQIQGQNKQGRQQRQQRQGGQGQNQQAPNMRGQNGKDQNPQTPNIQGQNREGAPSGAPSQDGVDGTSSASVNKN